MHNCLFKYSSTEREEGWLSSAAAAAKSLQSCLTLCNSIDGSPPGSPPLGFSRQEHWRGLPFPSLVHESEEWKWSHSVGSDLATPWTTAYQAPPSTGFSRQEHWSGCHCLLPDSLLVCTIMDNATLNISHRFWCEHISFFYWDKCIWRLSCVFSFEGFTELLSLIESILSTYPVRKNTEK